MDHFKVVNQLLVDLFNGILEKEEKHIITGEFKDISLNDMHIIEAVGLNSKKNMSAVAKILEITVGTLTIAINNLVKKGYVDRVRGEKDRRVVFISLSPKGEKAYRHHMEFHNQMTKEILDKLSEDEATVLVKALNSVDEYLKV